jgi:uncharacterized integral membrane protein
MYILTVLVGAAGAIFALQNIDPVVIRFLFWRIEGAPLAMVIILSIAIGVVLTSLVGIVQQLKLRSRIRKLEYNLAQATAARERLQAERTPQCALWGDQVEPQRG